MIKRGTHPNAIAGGRLHFFRKILQYGTRHRSAVLILRLKGLAIGGKDGEDLIQVIIIFEAFVKALFESHTGKQQNAHRQPQRQREDFDNVGTMPPQ